MSEFSITFFTVISLMASFIKSFFQIIHLKSLRCLKKELDRHLLLICEQDLSLSLYSWRLSFLEPLFVAITCSYLYRVLQRMTYCVVLYCHWSWVGITWSMCFPFPFCWSDRPNCRVVPYLCIYYIPGSSCSRISVCLPVVCCYVLAGDSTTRAYYLICRVTD